MGNDISCLSFRSFWLCEDMGTRVEAARPVRKAISVQHRMMTAWTRVVVMKMKRILSILRETSGFGLEAKSVGTFFNFFFFFVCAVWLAGS